MPLSQSEGSSEGEGRLFLYACIIQVVYRSRKLNNYTSICCPDMKTCPHLLFVKHVFVFSPESPRIKRKDKNRKQFPCVSVGAGVGQTPSAQ